MPRRKLLSTLLVLILTLPAAKAASRSGDQCFAGIPSISDCLSGRFAQYWQGSGGLPVFGYPITPVFDAAARDGAVMAQMLERNRLEYHPELRPPYDILLGRLGEDLLVARGRDWHNELPGTPQAGCWFAGLTRHSVCDQETGIGFLSYYRSHGLDLGDPGISQRESLALFGLPLTEPAVETNAAGDTVITQWFERARFEYHPEKPRAYRVLLGLLGNETWIDRARPATSLRPMPPILGAPPSLPLSPEPAPSATPKPSPTQAVTPSPTPSRPTSTPLQTVSPSPALAPGDDALKERLLELVDSLHQQAGCPAFTRDARLYASAQTHDEDIAAHKRIDHIGTDGSTLRERLDRVGYPYLRASESIAVYRTPEEVVGFWMDESSDGPHRMNITGCQYTDIGIGIAYDDRGWRWWVMDVASQRSGS